LHRWLERVLSVAVKGAGFAPRAARAPLTESAAATMAAKEKISRLLNFASCNCHPHFQKPRLEKNSSVARSRQVRIGLRAAPVLGFGPAGAENASE